MTIAARYEIEHLQYLGADGALVNEPPADLVDTKLLLPLFKQMLFVRVFDTKAIALQRTGKLSARAVSGLGIALRVPARSDATQYLTLDASVGSSTPDTAAGNNQAQYRNRIVGVP